MCQRHEGSWGRFPDTHLHPWNLWSTAWDMADAAKAKSEMVLVASPRRHHRFLRGREAQWREPWDLEVEIRVPNRGMLGTARGPEARRGEQVLCEPLQHSAILPSAW